MIVRQTNRFESQAQSLDKEKQLELKNILLKIVEAKEINQIQSDPLLGLPHCLKIDFSGHYIVFEIINNEIELSGIVTPGTELSLFF